MKSERFPVLSFDTKKLHKVAPPPFKRKYVVAGDLFKNWFRSILIL